MSEAIPDPMDNSRWIIGSGAESRYGAQVGPVTISRVHPESACAGRPCVLHNPSEHHMRSWTLNWRDDRGLMERLCPKHGIGHPDPDAMSYFRERGMDYMGVHGCCGCCRV